MHKTFSAPKNGGTGACTRVCACSPPSVTRMSCRPEIQSQPHYVLLWSYENYCILFNVLLGGHMN